MPARVAKIFFALWLLDHLFYPLWFPLYGSLKYAIILFASLLTLGVAIAIWLRPVLLQPSLPEEGGDPAVELLAVPQDVFLWILLVLIVATRLYPLTLPIHLWEGGDEGVHMGVPALPFKLVARNLFFPYPIAAWIIFGLAFYCRRRIADICRKFFRAILEFRPIPILAGAIFIACYFAAVFLVVRFFFRNGHSTFPADLLRFPPLCKWVRVPFYALLGVSNFSGRLPEFLFFIATGLLLYKILAEFRSKSIARIGAAIFWLLPPFTYYGTRGSQTEGEVFFFVLVCWFFAQWALRGRQSALYWAALSVAAGSMYRYTVPLLAIVLAVMIVWSWIQKDRQQPVNGSVHHPPWRVLVECGSLMTLMIAPWMISYFCYKLRLYVPLQQNTAWGKLITPAWALPRAVSGPAAALLAGGLLVALVRKKDELQRYLLLWFAAYYLFIGLDAADVIRLDMPMYVPLIIWAAELVFVVVKDDRWARMIGLGIAGYLFILTTFVPVAPMEPRFSLLHSLKAEYVPLASAAKELDRMPDGTRVLAVDCSPGCFTMELPRPHALDWTNVQSNEIPSLRELRNICADHKIDVVMYTAGTPEAMGTEGNARLLSQFENPVDWLSPRKEYWLGRNTIIFKDVHLTR